MELAYNRRTVKKRAATAGRFRFIEKKAQAARLCEQPIIEEPLKTKRFNGGKICMPIYVDPFSLKVSQPSLSITISIC